MTTIVDAKILRAIKDGAFRRLPTKRRASTNLYVLEDVQPAKSVIKARHQAIPIKQPTAVVFVDDEPMANWSHDCRYLLHDADSGKLYQEVKAGFPSYLVNPPDTFKAFHTPIVAQNPLRKLWTLDREIVFPWPWRIRKGNRYAILFSGASNNRHTNDLEFLYRQLVDGFYFDEDNITVLNYDGTINYSGGPKPVTSWPGDGTAYTMPVHGAGTKQALEDAIDALKPKLQQDDLLLIHTNNHGGYNGTESYLCTYSGPDYMASDFASKLRELPAFADLVVMMEQCHSGGFNDVVIEASTATRTTFAAACTERKSSIGGADFDPFARDWIAAFAGADPYGAALVSDPDYDSSGRISAREGFAYADDVHHSYDSPVYSAYGTDAGDQHLHQKWRYLFVYREFVLQELRLLRDGLRDPIQYRQAMKTKVLPALTELDDKLAVKPVEPVEAQEMIRKIIHSVAE
ncbi:MAG: caspase family protein [Deltaproteobacteria bacterium]|nr:caspase family protein [Candidatus Tharpella sp.]